MAGPRPSAPVARIRRYLFRLDRLSAAHALRGQLGDVRVRGSRKTTTGHLPAPAAQSESTHTVNRCVAWRFRQPRNEPAAPVEVRLYPAPAPRVTRFPLETRPVVAPDPASLRAPQSVQLAGIPDEVRWRCRLEP